MEQGSALMGGHWLGRLPHGTQSQEQPAGLGGSRKLELVGSWGVFEGQRGLVTGRYHPQRLYRLSLEMDRDQISGSCPQGLVSFLKREVCIKVLPVPKSDLCFCPLPYLA